MARAEFPAKLRTERVRTLAVIPAYNEATTIANVVAGARAHLPVMVVDDGSHDETARQAEAAGALVLRRQLNQGKGAALRAGFRYALAEGYEAVVTLDADGQHDPAEIPKFLYTRAERGSDLIIGARDFSQMPLVRRLANAVGRWSLSWALGTLIEDNQCGYRLISRRMMEASLAGVEQGFEFEVEMIVLCLQRGYRLDWVPIRTIYQGEQSHISPWRHAVNWLRLLRRVRGAVRSGELRPEETGSMDPPL